jgi:hypothetical protein
MPPSAEISAAPFVPEKRTLPVLQQAVQHCRGCDLYRHATQAVFGELETGSNAAKPKVVIMMIGEQPGDQEVQARAAIRRSRRQVAGQMPGRIGHRSPQSLRDQHGGPA